MIELFSLFLGLTAGVQTVELVVLEPVAEVELVLDGRSLGTVSGEPWSLDCDFGDLAPHELVAIGRDAAGREVERTRRWVNLAPSWEGQTRTILRVPDRSPVVVTLEKGAELPPAEEMGSWFLAGGEPAAVVSVEHGPAEHGPAEVVIVRDPAVQGELHAIADSLYEIRRVILRQAFQGTPRDVTTRPVGWMDLEPDEAASPLQAQILEAAQNDLRDAARLGPEVEVRFLSPWAAPLSHVESDRELFALTERIAADRRGFLEISAAVTSVTSAFRLADAVAAVAREAHGAARRRAVVILAADRQEDDSLFTPAQVRAYLRRLQVPLLVWSTVFEEADPEWGEVHHVGFRPRARQGTWPDAFKRVAAGLRRLLDLQRIVWLEGRHPPQSIALGEAARGIRLAGAGGKPP